MKHYHFTIGQKLGFSGLYGGWFAVEIVARTRDTVTMRETWTAEDTGRTCHHDEKRTVECEELADGITVERVVIWEYRGEKGFLYCLSDSEIDNLLGFEPGEDTEDWQDCPSATRGDYSPSNPWNAPGMSARDFI